MMTHQTKCGLPTKAAWKGITVKMRLRETVVEVWGWRWECCFRKVWLRSPDIYRSERGARAAAEEWLTEMDALPLGAVFLPEWLTAIESLGLTPVDL